MTPIKILTVFGTRPEVIKLIPLIKAFENDPHIINITCATTQHREMQNDLLDLFAITPTYNLDVMKNGQDLFYITETILHKLNPILQREQPDFLIVQGDTTTAFAAALSAFYNKIAVVHLEAGLRTRNIFSPFPEEANRSLISRIASLHMTPTDQATHNLNKEDITQGVYQVGNTIVDSIYMILEHFTASASIKEFVETDKKKILVTAHRRENFGIGIKSICSAVHKLSQQFPDHIFIWPVHPNPNIKPVVEKQFENSKNVYLIVPLAYPDLINILKISDLILSDSGGIQEEACILGKRILVLRDETERPEVIESGYGTLVGCNEELILTHAQAALLTKELCLNNLNPHVFGKRGVAQRILTAIKNYQLDPIKCP
ncbi:non-hydrolyzing UDP-N-acetylglucosamine 2-epimerase [Candidatus Odyssella acanthamoebae]|uniref:UDP-N-acetylglucosamine 2-epimerase (non-hydrolyzing) n=1 Tax=Candidatus Odyssella acanthamoebae TaxID=91604 RepID=A0A077AZ76_9PROT|nr:UDP-N-acetylglucosamine 2-epimerase (non-hydrolyzing) [Candidatus Paracaedibacter acanthamoebae]AIK96943.1 hypothetical protein ID47_09715 [Candidatus Paracaedibacter acanthamoebae]